VAIVTGSSSGIGRGIAHRFAVEGARVVVNGRNQAKVERVLEEIRGAGGEAIGVVADLGYREQAERLFSETLSAFGTVDVLVNNAAWADPTVHILDMDEEHWDTVLRSNLKSAFLCLHRAANIMVDQHKTGSVINISSFAAARAHRYMAAYDASKGGIEAFTRSTAIDLAPFGIRVNTVGPGPIHVGEEDMWSEEPRQRGENVPLGRAGLPSDIAGAVTFLASDDASYVTGQVIYVDGGALAQLRNPQVDPPLPESAARRLWRKPGP
jgi:3-oxoacyl-[acyl-carrier protein] reductase